MYNERSPTSKFTTSSYLATDMPSEYLYRSKAQGQGGFSR